MRRKSNKVKVALKALLLACSFSILSAGVCLADTATPSELPKTEEETSGGSQHTTGQTGWKKDSKGWQYYEAGEAVCDEWREKDGVDRYLGPDSYMMTEEEIFEGDDVYYVDKEGKKATRIWYWTNEGWRFFGSNGAAFKSNKYNIDDKYYIFDDDGVLMQGYVGFDGYKYFDVNGETDPIIKADSYCGEESDTPNSVFVGWHKYQDEIKDARYAGFDEIWVCYNSQGKKLKGTKTVDGREYEFDNNGILILGNIHINYYPSETNKDHHISEFYNAGAADATFISQGDTFEKEYPSDKYIFLHWVDDDGDTFVPGDPIPYDAGTYSLYGVWKEIGSGNTNHRSGSGGGGGNNKSRNTSVNTAQEANLNVGTFISGRYVSGQWKQAANGSWSFTDASGKNYTNTWAYVYNPYATGQEKAGWFMFDEKGNIRTGWYTDPTDGHTYYLNENAGTGYYGQMVTGWVQFGTDWYYFNEQPDGTRGCLLKGPVAVPN